MYAQLIKPGNKVSLSEYDPNHHAGLLKEAALAETQKLSTEFNELEDWLYSAGMDSLLIVLQGRDTSGKDGTIRHILASTNAQSCRVAPFKVPTPEELAHDFLWRVHSQTPGKGGMTIFNRSHYEDVLVVRVHNLVPESVWKPRYRHINHFEELLTDSNTIILKFFLHISKEEQEKRLRERESDVEKSWKLSVGDWKEREFWDEYTKAYEDALTECSTEHAPWYLVPANNKWYRNLAVSQVIVEELKKRKHKWEQRLKEIGRKAKAELEEYRAQNTRS